jgi:hypothetical protein
MLRGAYARLPQRPTGSSASTPQRGLTSELKPEKLQR